LSTVDDGFLLSREKEKEKKKRGKGEEEGKGREREERRREEENKGERKALIKKIQSEENVKVQNRPFHVYTEFD
jgi:hypothetical protein